ncbi:MAG: phosphatase PAP2 family protein [Simkaniaceae bacterium]
MDHFKKLFTFRQTLFLLLLLALAILSFFFLDKAIALTIAPTAKVYRPLFKTLSLCIFPPLQLLFWITLFLIARLSQSKRHWTLPLFEISAAQGLSVACVRLSKVVIGRARPDIFLKKGIFGIYGPHLDSHYHSFPSGHTIAAFTLATSLSFLYPRYKVAFYLLAFFLSSSRVFLADHYCSDVLGTACIGMGIATLTHTLVEKITGSNKKYTHENF